jgi:hypothetical protein
VLLRLEPVLVQEPEPVQELVPVLTLSVPMM